MFNVVYQTLCASLSCSYIGETGRSFKTRMKEHVRNTMKCAEDSTIANHAVTVDHAIDFDNTAIINKGTIRTRKTLDLGKQLKRLRLVTTHARFKTM